MADYTIDKFTYGGNKYTLKDKNAMPKSGGTFTGSVIFDDSITASDVTADSLVVQGNVAVVNGLQVTTINGETVGNEPAFTDTTYTANTPIEISDDNTITHATYTGAAGTYGSMSQVPKITVNATGHITGVVNTTISGVTPAAHNHGNITNTGDITASATPTSNDAIIMHDASASKLVTGPVFGTSSTTYLTNAGTWATPVGTTYTGSGAISVNSSTKVISVTTGTGANTVASGGHTHTTTLASDAGNASITLNYDKKYKLTTGGTNVIFAMPSASTGPSAFQTITAGDTELAAENSTDIQFIEGEGIKLTAVADTSNHENKLTVKNDGAIYSIMSGFTTTAGSASSPYLSVKWSVPNVNGITTPYNGMRVAIKVPMIGVGTAGAVMSIDGGTTWHPLLYNYNTLLTSHYPANSIKYFTYDANQSANAYITAGTATSITGVWKADADYYSFYYTSAWCPTAAATQAKAASYTSFVLKDKSYVPILFTYTNTYANKITLNINGTGAKDIYLNGTISSSSNYNLPAGTYLAYYADSKYYINTDGTIPNVATSAHIHAMSLASGGTATVNLTANTAYTLTAGGSSVVFKTPTDNNSDTKVSSSNSTSKLFLVGATTQSTLGQVGYSHSSVYETNGALHAASFNGYTLGAACSMATGTTAGTVATGNHAHTATLSKTGSASINLEADATYTLTAGGSTVVFKTPADKVTGVKGSSESSYRTGQVNLTAANVGAVSANTAITGNTKCKITYDSKGLVTGGTDLAASDIPNLAASKITSGTFADARIASATTWNNKLSNGFSTISVGSASINADGDDSFELVAGTGITLTPDTSNNKITIASSGGGGSGDVVGPSSSTANHIVTFDNATGKKIKDSGLDINAATCHAVMSGFTTTAGSASSPYLSVKWKISGINGITAPYDGMRVAIKIPLAGVGTAGVLLSIDGGTTWHPVAYNINTVLTTHYPANTVKYFTYDASQTMTGYATAGTATTYTGVWKADADYDSNSNTYTTAWCSTAAATQAKVASCSNFVLTANTFIPILFTQANSYNGKITLNINSTGAKDIYINGTVSSSSNKTLPAGTYIAYYDGSHYIINTNGTIPKVAPAYQYSTTDLTPGTSTLATGTLYFVYE